MPFFPPRPLTPRSAVQRYETLLQQLENLKLSSELHTIRLQIVEEVRSLKGWVALPTLTAVLDSTCKFLNKPVSTESLENYVKQIKTQLNFPSKLLLGLSILMTLLAMTAFVAAWMFLTPLMPASTVATFVAALTMVVAVMAVIALGWSTAKASIGCGRLMSLAEQIQSSSTAKAAAAVDPAPVTSAPALG